MTEFVNIARAEVDPRFVLEYVNAFESALPGILKEEGCLAYSLSVSDTHPNVIWHYELYTEEAAFEAHRRLPHIVAFREAITPLLLTPIQPERSSVVALKR